jgi:hypothetical protein
MSDLDSEVWRDLLVSDGGGSAKIITSVEPSDSDLDEIRGITGASDVDLIQIEPDGEFIIILSWR